MAGPAENKTVARPPLVFVAEDDPHLLDLAVLILQSEGCDCRAFATGEAALTAFRSAAPKPSLIVSDFSMGNNKMTGTQFLAECKKLKPDLKTFLVSGSVDELTVREDGRPVDRFLGKPFKAAEFVQIIRELIR